MTKTPHSSCIALISVTSMLLGAAIAAAGDGTFERQPFEPVGIDQPFLGTYKTQTEDFERLTGIPTRLHLTYTGRKDGWAALEGRGPRYNRFPEDEGNPMRKWIMSYALMPDGIAGEWPQGPVNLPRCAAGEFNENYARFARRMEQRGIANIILRPGWEWSHDSWGWGTGNDVTLGEYYAACFREFVRTVDTVYPDNRFLYDWNAHQGVNEASLHAAWPGEAYVDIVSIDIYDEFWGPARCSEDPACRWERKVQPKLDMIKEFAAEKNKPLGMPELGIISSHIDERGGGDNPYFIERICNWVKDPDNNYIYYVYFNRDTERFNHTLDDHPQALAAFQEHCVGNPGNPHELLSRRGD